MNLWTYWQPGQHGTPESIKLMLESIVHYNPTAVVLDDDMVRDLGGQCVIDATQNRHLVYRSDLLRFWLLREFGGGWLDADYVCFRENTLIPPIEEGADFSARLNVITKRIASNAIASQKGGTFVSAAYDEALHRLKTRAKLKWIETGPAVLTMLGKKPKHKGLVHLVPSSDYPQQFRHQLLQERNRDAGHRRSVIWNPCAVGYHIANWTVNRTVDWPRERLLEGKSFLAFLFRNAFKQLPAK